MSGVKPPPGFSGIGGIERPERTRATDAIAPADGAESVATSSVVEATNRNASAAAIEQIGQALASGAIDPAQARAQLIDAVVQAKLPAGIDAALAAEIRAEVEALLAADPMLERLLDPAST